ncbi:hypothetical protein VOLCADRAFT_97200 [Volvox carteri f. nagariensis]|uniref:Uncharacterized protein n=1 Tax=Volvox carteri f. nagariensis TaxID=3068 RepID=D8UC48_VOLCA|nr:uncharacterized protein VOLCADRAFT_97200 [Volvox carteri f. nagariensis]EFJ42736.1 hypothetical protein VOLCADRAFT_97200 [Volvox carteri f. nagariensis]|eukprot:XP_002956197.1 hypothetical protein VOLCADRAFT_97200 [Volvox carteri f. nagariensis]
MGEEFGEQNIWHSTLRSKKLKSRSLLRAYAREVQERGDSTAARLEAFRSAVKLTKSNEDAGTDACMSDMVGHGRARPLPSSDQDEEEPAGDGSPHQEPQFADSAEATYLAKKALPKPCPTGSSEGADAASLTSDPTSPLHNPALRLSSRAQKGGAHDLGGQEGSPQGALGLSALPPPPQRSRAAAGCELPPRARRPDAKMMDNNGAGAAVPGSPAEQLRAQRLGLHWPQGGPGRGLLDPAAARCVDDAALDFATAAAAALEPHGVSLQHLMLRQQQQRQQQLQQQERSWQERTGGRATSGSTPSARGEAGEGGEARRRFVGAGGGGEPRMAMDEGMGLDLSGAGVGAGAEELARLQTLLMFQSAMERGQLGGLQDAAAAAAAGSGAWMSPRRPAGLAQALAQAQMQAMALAQAQASLEADEVHRLALMRHYFALQMQQGGGAAAAAALGGVAGDTSGASSGWRFTEARSGGSRGVQRDAPRGSAAHNATGRRAYAPAQGSSAAAAAAASTTSCEDYFGDRGAPLPPMPAPGGAITCLGPAVMAALAASAAVPGFDPYAMVPPQYLPPSLEQMGALLGGGGNGAVERLLGAHAAAAATRAAAAEAAAVAGRMAGLHPAGLGPWGGAAPQDSMEAEDPGVATGPSSADTLTAVDLRASDEAPSADGKLQGRPAPAVVPPHGAEARRRTGAKRRAEPSEDADAPWGGQRLKDGGGGSVSRLAGGLDNPHAQGLPSGPVAWPPLPFFGGIRGNPIGNLYGNPLDQHDFALQAAWAADGNVGGGMVNGFAAAASGFGAAPGAAALGALRGAGPRGLGAAADRVSMPGSAAERRWDVAALHGGGGGGGLAEGGGALDRKPPRRRPQRQPREDVDDVEDDEPQQQQQHPELPQQRQQQQVKPNNKQEAEEHQEHQQHRRRRPEQKQQQRQQQQQQQIKSEDQKQGLHVDDEAVAADLSICDVARALLSFSQQKPRPATGPAQGRGSSSGRTARSSE